MTVQFITNSERVQKLQEKQDKYEVNIENRKLQRLLENTNN